MLGPGAYLGPISVSPHTSGIHPTTKPYERKLAGVPETNPCVDILNHAKGDPTFSKESIEKMKEMLGRLLINTPGI